MSQGSVLGPLLFLLYTNNLLFVQPSSTTYADDSAVYAFNSTLSDVIALLNTYLRNINSWTKENFLSSNHFKYNYMIIKPTKSNVTVDSVCHVLLNEVPLNQVASLKLLGIIISNKLEWNDLVTHLKGKINQNFVPCIILAVILNRNGVYWFVTHLFAHISCMMHQYRVTAAQQQLQLTSINCRTGHSE